MVDGARTGPRGFDRFVRSLGAGVPSTVVSREHPTLNRRELLALAAVRWLRPSFQDVEPKLVGILPLGPRERAAPLDRLLGSGLDARRFTDLATLTPETLVIPNERFFIRTACPEAAERRSSWSLRISGPGREPEDLSIESLRARARPMGTHLLECSGNSDPSNFGLMSAAAWEGVPLSLVLDAQASRVLIGGVNDVETPSRTSEPGASWVFTREDLEKSGAFLATGMNGTPLSRHHGFPLRLVVPGWYACCSIKWIDRIELVPEDAPATAQMLEFASRTHQEGTQGRTP